jgi:hypothetical protein
MRIAFFCLFLFTYIANFAQMLDWYHDKTLPEILKQKISHTDIVIEGAVIEEKGFYDTITGHGIYTSALIKVSRVFKGLTSDSLLEVIFIGGKIGDNLQIVTDIETLNKGAEGVFFLINNNTGTRLRKDVKSYFINGTPVRYYHDHVNRHANIYSFFFDDFEKDLYPEIEKVTGTPAKVLGLNIFEQEALKKQRKK